MDEKGGFVLSRFAAAAYTPQRAAALGPRSR